VQARLGQSDVAERELRQLTQRQAAALPFDQEWLFGMSLLAETAALLADVDAATRAGFPSTNVALRLTAPSC
jgi:hypothetical protein